jgi:hypothetical protein
MRGLSAFDVYLPVLISFVIGVLTPTYLPGEAARVRAEQVPSGPATGRAQWTD